jgi:phosphatidylinositol 4-kinase B
MPLWCSTSDTPQPTNGLSQPHHRIVRIPPGESVVLNSAERAPYLLLVEILNDDLDFDPTKRANKEVLKRIVSKENEAKGASRDLISFNLSGSYGQKSIEHVVDSETALSEDTADVANVIQPTPSSDAENPGEEEEIDLVEQLYGTSESLRRPIDLSESIVLPPTPKNRELDMAAWSRSSSIPPSPLMDAESSLTGTPPTSAFTWTPSSRPSLPSSQFLTPGPNDMPGNSILSLDEYSERMRTAAVMLAQLNANLVRESVTALPATPGLPANPDAQLPVSGSLSWIPGSSWLAGASDQASSGGPIHPSLPGGQYQNTSSLSSAASSRMKVQFSEAAAIRDRIMTEMLALEEERMERMREHREGESMMQVGHVGGGMKTEDEGIIRRELNRVDPSAIVFSESWASKKASITSCSLTLFLTP